jgi:photosystem II stability/assembly factor-like uncharacterized protein
MNCSAGTLLLRILAGLLISKSVCCAQSQLTEPKDSADENASTEVSAAASEKSAGRGGGRVASESIGGNRTESALPQTANRRQKGQGAEQITVASAPDGTFTLIESESPAAVMSAGGVARGPQILDDATLNDVSCVGGNCWAVGDRGVICYSADAGESWLAKCVPFECRLTSVCFLTNRIGWVGGVEPQPGLPGGRAVLLSTRDGGITWTNLVFQSRTRSATADGLHRLPGIRQIQYFGLEEAVAVTFPDQKQDDSTLVRSSDGGLTWDPIASDKVSASWIGGWFSGSNAGVVVGGRQSLASIASGEAVIMQEPASTLRCFRSVALEKNGRGWLAGDGATLLQTEDGGVTWKAPAVDLPAGLADVLDFHSVVVRGETMIACGNPGSVLLRTVNEGQTWQVVEADFHGQIHRLRAQGESGILAVGSFGQILKSDDDGQSWRTVRNRGYHSGILCLVTDAEKSPWALLATLTADAGVRSVVHQPSDRLESLAAEGVGVCNTERACEALGLLGVNQYSSDWMFPRSLAEQHKSSESLMDEWNRRTDGRMRELIPLRLARSIRTYQPRIVIVESSGDNDAVAELMRSAVKRAIELAADPEQIALTEAGLKPWSVFRVLSRASTSQQTTLMFQESDLLPALGTTCGLVCDAAENVFGDAAALLTGTESQYSDLSAAYDLEMDFEARAAIRNALEGLEGALTSDVRRPSSGRTREDLAKLRNAIGKSRTEAAALRGHGVAQQAVEAFVAELSEVGASLPPSLALRQLRELSELSRERNNTEGYLAVQQEIVRRFPETEDAWRAAESLIWFYGSAETRYFRLRGQMFPAASSVASVSDGSQATRDLFAPTSNAGSSAGLRPQIQMGAAGSFSPSATSQLEAVNEAWTAQEETAWRILREHVSVRSGQRGGPSEESKLRRATTLRGIQKNGEATTLFSEAAVGTSDVAFWATSEMQILQRGKSGNLRLMNVPQSSSRPVLDGRLTDEIWENAEEIRLLSEDRDSVSQVSTVAGDSDGRDADCLCMLAWDEQFLYFAARLERRERSRRIPPASARQHDEDHQDRDRIELCVDTDRDYLTAFRFVIDESGRTSEQCWWLSRWNPDWFVAVDSDDSAWRVEAAIPLNELSNPTARPGMLWSVRFRRVLPGYLEQSLPALNGMRSAGGAGLIRFVRPKLSAR